MTVIASKPTSASYYINAPESMEILLTSAGETARSNPIIERVVGALGLYKIPLDYEKNFASKLKRYLIDINIRKLQHKLESMSPEQKDKFLFSMAVKNLKSRLRIEPIRSTNMFQISVLDYSPNGAVVIANILSRVYIIYDLEQQLAEFRLEFGERHTTTLKVKDKIDELKKSFDQKILPDIEALGPASIKIVEQAKESLPIIPYNEGVLLPVSGVLGLVLGIMFAFGLEYMNPTIKSPRDIETYLNIFFLGSIPKIKSKYKKLLTNTDTDMNNTYAQSFRTIHDEVYLLRKDKNLKTILVVDAEAAEDTALIVANLGIFSTFAEADANVLIIDANLRTPSISKVFNISNDVGLADVLEGKAALIDALNKIKSNLFILPTGKIVLNPSVLLTSSALPDLMMEAKEKYEVIFIACADLRFTDAVLLSAVVDSIILVINEGGIRRHILKAAIAPLELKNVTLHGAILNNRTFVIPKIVYNRI